LNYYAKIADMNSQEVKIARESPKGRSACKRTRRTNGSKMAHDGKCKVEQDISWQRIRFLPSLCSHSHVQSIEFRVR